MKTSTQNKSDIFHILLLNKEKIINYGAKRLGLFGKEVELVTPESLSPYLKPYIEREIEYVTFTN
jgi:predicted nucleotidyltransferase